MPFVVKDLKQLIDEAESGYAALQDYMPVSERKIRARNLARVCNELTVYIGFLGKQIIPTTSEKEYLEAHCAPKGIFRKQKSAAYGPVTVKGLLNTPLPAGTILIRKTDNMKYKVADNYTMTGEPQSIKLICTKGGTAGNAAAGEILDFAVIIPGIESTATVELIGAGADVESDRDLLARYLEVVRNVYHGGADSDYKKWALSIEGVNRAWAYPCEMGVGTMTVRVMTPDGFPDAQLLKKVADYIDTVRPPTYNEFFVVSPIAKPINIAFSTLTPDTAEIREALTEALKTALDKVSEPGKPVLLSRLTAAILSVLQSYENYDYQLLSPDSNIECGIGELAILGEVTWTS